jgi:clan AA aspartic protease
VGTFTIPIEVGDLAGTQFVRVTALVDTGSTYTIVPGPILHRLGVPIKETHPCEMADNRIMEYPIGYATVRLNGREVIALVVFAPENSSPLIGATTLELAGLAVDPVHRRLVRSRPC